MPDATLSYFVVPRITNKTVFLTSSTAHRYVGHFTEVLSTLHIVFSQLLPRTQRQRFIFLIPIFPIPRFFQWSWFVKHPVKCLSHSQQNNLNDHDDQTVSAHFSTSASKCSRKPTRWRWFAQIFRNRRNYETAVQSHRCTWTRVSVDMNRFSYNHKVPAEMATWKTCARALYYSNGWKSNLSEII